jgi:superfamily II DNA/RNA helicase
MDFSELGLSQKTIHAINEAGITAPTTVQADVIPSVLAGKDVFAIAPARCGKTCSYVFPLIEIISRHEAQNILIITAGSKQSVVVSDCFAVFNKYHEINEAAPLDSEEDINKEANVIIASPSLLLDLVKEEKIELSKINILVVDDINLIKKYHQLENLEAVLADLPAEKQNIVFTNRRSKETQDILDRILQTPAEIKVNRDKEQEIEHTEMLKTSSETENKAEDMMLEKDVNAAKKNKYGKKERKAESPKLNRRKAESERDAEAMDLMKKYHTFGRRTPEFLLTKAELAVDDNQ